MKLIESKDAEHHEMATMVAAVVHPKRFLTISEIAKSLPGHRGNECPTPSTVARWIVRGVRSLNGQTVRLRAIRAGGRWLVEPDALAEFFAALGELPAAGTPTPSRSPNARTKASNVAAVKLQALGA
jgi:hypothetical protein